MMDCFDLTGKVALITGASSGLGAEFAHALAYRGADVVILARRKEKLKATADDARELGHKALPIACDVTDKAAVKAAVDQAVAELGTIDIPEDMDGLVQLLASDGASYTTGQTIAIDGGKTSI